MHSYMECFTQFLQTPYGYQMPLLNILPSIDVTDFAKFLLKYSTDGILLTDSTGLVVAMNKRLWQTFSNPNL